MEELEDESRALCQQRVYDMLCAYRDKYGKEDFRVFLPAAGDFVLKGSPSTSTVNLETLTEPTEDGYQKTKKRSSKRTRTEVHQQVTVSNSFESLTEMEQEQTITNDKPENSNAVSESQIKQTQTNQHRQKTVPLIITESQKWGRISKIIKSKNLVYNKAKMVKQGVHLEPATEEDYRGIFHLLKNEKVEFYTYQLKSEKRLKVVIRGVLTDIPETEISNDLHEQGYPVTKVKRMKGRNKQDIPLVLVELDKQFKSIYNNLRFCCGLSVTTESLKIREGIVQCHKCQKFGHTQANCHTSYRCMKCGAAHSTHECTKSPTSDAHCANCGGAHLSTFIRCTENPNNPANRPPTLAEKSTPAPPPKVNAWHKDTPASSQLFSSLPQKSTDTSKDDELALLLGRMYLTFCSSNPTQEAKLKFLDDQTALIQLFRHK